MTDWKRGKRRKEELPAGLLLGHAVKSCMTVIRINGWGAIASNILQGILAGAFNAGVLFVQEAGRSVFFFSNPMKTNGSGLRTSA